MFGDMMDKLQNMRQQMDEVKSRLDNVTVKGEAGNGKVTVIATGNRKIKEIKIDPALMTSDPEELEDLLIMALNQALENAEKVNESEMQGAASGMLPGLEGLMGK
ncbi:MAG: YbaB/EbfC family nucleoid-associated protein [Flavobacteriales bacterium]|nr:YbaB/EbfC family nucleoid-associated protein [Flavobacteriales bacterium]